MDVINVCHNVTLWSPDGRGREEYQPGDLLVVVFETTRELTGVGDLTPIEWCEWAWRLFDGYDKENMPVTKAYFAAENRALSMGDVVIVDNAPYACTSFGWKMIDRDSLALIDRTQPGTNPDWRVTTA
jgi:hypothetical protein